MGDETAARRPCRTMSHTAFMCIGVTSHCCANICGNGRWEVGKTEPDDYDSTDILGFESEDSTEKTNSTTSPLRGSTLRRTKTLTRLREKNREK